MSRTLSMLVFVLALGAAPASAQTITDDASAADSLRELQHGAESVSSGLAEVQRSLLGIRWRGADEVGSARLVLTYEDHFVGLTPIAARFSLDGQSIYTTTDAAAIERGQIYAGPIPSGPHVLTMELRYRGDILYTTGYRIALRSSYGFATPLDRTTHVRVIGHDRSPFAAPPDRWTVDFAAETDPTE